MLESLDQNLDAALVAELTLEYARPAAKWPRRDPDKISRRERHRRQLYTAVGADAFTEAFDNGVFDNKRLPSGAEHTNYPTAKGDGSQRISDGEACEKVTGKQWAYHHASDPTRMSHRPPGEGKQSFDEHRSEVEFHLALGAGTALNRKPMEVPRQVHRGEFFVPTRAQPSLSESIAKQNVFMLHLLEKGSETRSFRLFW
jgi:hypothetical protein